jgi:hypothetical protein
MRQKVTTDLDLVGVDQREHLAARGKFWVTLLLLAIAIGVTLHLVLLKTYRPETAPTTQASSSEPV